MKKYFYLLIVLPMFFGCSNNNFSNNNPYLPNYPVNISINMNLPTYSKLLYVSNAIYYPDQGVRGVIIFNTTGKDYVAFDAACPNQVLSSCSTMTIGSDGINAICPCDSAIYSLFTGQSAGKEYPLKQYRVEVNGNVLRVYN